MDTIEKFIVSKLHLKERNLEVTLNYDPIIYGHLISGKDFEMLAGDRCYRFLLDENFGKYKHHLYLQNKKNKIYNDY